MATKAMINYRKLEIKRLMKLQSAGKAAELDLQNLELQRLHLQNDVYDLEENGPEES